MSYWYLAEKPNLSQTNLYIVFALFKYKIHKTHLNVSFLSVFSLVYLKDLARLSSSEKILNLSSGIC